MFQLSFKARVTLHHQENNSSVNLLHFSDSEMQLLKEVPLYNDVMLPSTSEKIALQLSPLTPSDNPSPALAKMEPGAEEFSFSSTAHRNQDTANTPSSTNSSSEVDTSYCQ